ncbi:MAG: metallophosphoesterase [Candidatus Hydrogenedentes bacterium]|nr:metallophosphoesterase [Candidatus Hydrogenedentota bacterium]
MKQNVISASRLFSIPLLFLVAGFANVSCPKLPDLTPQPNPTGVHWLRFAQITDVHIVDDESPARAVRADHLISSSWRPQEAYATQVLDATLNVINQHHTGKLAPALPMDFVLVTGDLTDSALHNELRWFMDTMDGKQILPDSGALDGAQREADPLDNPKLEFQATGLAMDIPWYTAFGNHDGLVVGTFGIDRAAADPQGWTSPLFGPVAAVLGLHALTPATNRLNPVAAQSPAIIAGGPGPMDPVTLQLQINQLGAGPIASDAQRHFSSRAQFIEEHFNSTTTPAGHGLTDSNRVSGKYWYSLHPKAGAPIRVIVLDTAAPDPTPLGFPISYGVMTREQFESFLKPEIRAAQAAGEFVIVVSHHPSTDFNLPYPADTVSTPEFRSYLSSQANVIAHLCGHTHRHKVSAISGFFPYYEIETGSLIDYPQEGRIFDVFYLPESGDVRLESRMVSHMEDPTRLSAESFRRAQIDAANGKSAEDAEAAEEFATLFPDPKSDFGASYVLPASASISPNLSAEDRYGTQGDRDFSVVLHRPGVL